MTASSVRPSRAFERTSTRRKGNGRARLDGSYTGHEATDIEVKITAAAGTPRASVPVMYGVGNGPLSVVDVTPAAALQSITLTLADLGINTQTAGLDVREVRIIARTPGAAGNAISVVVTPQLTVTRRQSALLQDWPAGEALTEGVQWDLGGLPLSGTGEIDPASGRLRFGDAPQIYRQYRVFKDGAWRFGLSPAPQDAIRAGTPIFDVAGGYDVAITDGATTENYPGIVTFYDLLTAIAGSALVDVAGVVTADRAPGGQGIIDLPIRTDAWLLSLSGKTLEAVTVPGTAPTQSIVVRCVNNDIVGQERWSVTGDVSGSMPAALTGIAYAVAGVVGFKIPSVPQASEVGGDATFRWNPQARDTEKGEVMPCASLKPIKLGANASPQTVTFRYAVRPPQECDCSKMPPIRVPEKCLGINTTGGGGDVLDPEHGTRLQALYEWRRDFHAANWVNYYVPPKDLDFADAIAEAFTVALGEIYEEPAARDEWDLALADMIVDLQPLENPQFENAWNAGNLWGDTNAAYRPNSIADSLESPTLPGAPPYIRAYHFPDATGYKLAGEISTTVANLVRKYTARMDYCRTLAGIIPKSDPNSTDAGGCWVDHGDSHWWIDADGIYLPAFTNKPYISARRDSDGKAYSTKEFGFGLVVACPEHLKIGDEITLRILTVDVERPYRVGDEAIIQTVGAGPAYLVGGVDGTDEHTWHVESSALGAAADYVVPIASPTTDYTGLPGVVLNIEHGGIPFELGDSFTLAIEAGQYQWRRDSGPWSPAADIPLAGAGAALADGLSVFFDAGPAPSFVPDDVTSYRVHQPHAVSHIRDATPSVWAWEGAGGTLTADLGSVTAIGALALARYELPAGAVVVLQLSDDGSTWGAATPLDMSRAVCVQVVAASARYVRLSVAGALGGHIGWLYVGAPLATENHATTCKRTRRWATTRLQSAPNAARLTAGAGDGWEVGWEDILTDTDARNLLELVEFAQACDEPLIFLPHVKHPHDAALVRVGDDAVQIADWHEYQPDDAARRLLSATFVLEPVYS